MTEGSRSGLLSVGFKRPVLGTETVNGPPQIPSPLCRFLLPGHCNLMVHICPTTRLQPRIGTVLRTCYFHMTLALSLTAHCQLPRWLNLPSGCAFLNST